MGKKNKISRTEALNGLLYIHESQNKDSCENTSLLEELEKVSNGKTSVQEFYREVRKSPGLKKELERFNHTERTKRRNGN